MIIDNSIITQCLQEQSDKSFQLLYEKTIPYVYSIVKRYINHVEQRKDTTQDVYAQVFLNLKSYDANKAPFRVWLRKVTVNTCLMQLRKSKIQYHVVNIEDKFTLADHPHELLTQLKRADIEKYLDQMPVGYRTIFMLHVIDGYDHTEISKELEINIQTSRSQLSRAKNWIRKQLIHTDKSRAYGIL